MATIPNPNPAPDPGPAPAVPPAPADPIPPAPTSKETRPGTKGSFPASSEVWDQESPTPNRNAVEEAEYEQHDAARDKLSNAL